MNQNEIKQKILFNNQKLETLIKPGQFVLNPEIANLLKENDELRAQCNHEYENGVCIYCNKPMED